MIRRIAGPDWLRVRTLVYCRGSAQSLRCKPWPNGPIVGAKMSMLSPTTAVSSSIARGPSRRPMDLTVVIPAAGEAANLALLLPQIVKSLTSLRIEHEILIVTPDARPRSRSGNGRRATCESSGRSNAAMAGRCCAGSARQWRYILTMDADLSHPPTFIRTLWEARDVGGSGHRLALRRRAARAEMPRVRTCSAAS